MNHTCKQFACMRCGRLAFYCQRCSVPGALMLACERCGCFGCNWRPPIANIVEDIFYNGTIPSALGFEKLRGKFSCTICASHPIGWRCVAAKGA